MFSDRVSYVSVEVRVSLPRLKIRIQPVTGFYLQHTQVTALNNASGQRREMRAIARKKLEPTGGLFKNGLNYMGFPCDKNNANG